MFSMSKNTYNDETAQWANLKWQCANCPAGKSTNFRKSMTKCVLCASGKISSAGQTAKIVHVDEYLKMKDLTFVTNVVKVNISQIAEELSARSVGSRRRTY